MQRNNVILEIFMILIDRFLTTSVESYTIFSTYIVDQRFGIKQYILQDTIIYKMFKLEFSHL